MKQLLFFSLFLLYSIIGFAQSEEWLQKFGQDSCSNSGTSCKVLPSTDILYAGYTLCGNDRSELNITRLYSNGIVQWEKTYDLGSTVYIGNAVLQDSLLVICGQIVDDNILDADPLIVWLDTNGNLLNSQQYNLAPGQQALKTIQPTPDKGWVACGYSTQTDGQSNDILVLKVNATGELEWQQMVGSPRNETAHCIVVTKNGYVVSGDKQEESSNQYDQYVFELTETGTLVWEYQSFDPHNDGNQALMIDQEGNYILTGESTVDGSVYFDVALTKLSPLGKLIWRKTAGKPFADTGFALNQNEKGEYLVSGYTLSDSTEYSNPYLAKFSKDGEPLGLRYIHLPDISIGYEINKVSGKEYLIPIYNQNDFYLAKLKDSLYEDNFTLSSALYNGLQTYTEPSLLYFPNPAQDHFTVLLKGNYRLRIRTLLGSVVWENTCNGPQEMAIGFLPNGCYCLEIEQDCKYLVEKLIIQR